MSHDSGLMSFAANPFAAMPSLHAMDALIVGIVMASVCRTQVARILWLAWPAWVTFAVMGTGNHYWLDCAAGFLSRSSSRRSSSAVGCAASSPAPRDDAARGAARQPVRPPQAGVRRGRAGDSPALHAGRRETKLTPDMLTLAGVLLCLAGAVLVGFEQRNEYLFFWLGGALFVVGSVADILDGALARAASKGTVFGAFLDSTFDRVGEAAILAAIGLSFMHDGNEIALMAAFAAVIGSFLVSYTRAKAEAIGLRGDVGFGSRVERVVLISVGLGLAPWGLLQWPIYVLAAIAWLTVAQRILFVRRQLRELAET